MQVFDRGHLQALKVHDLKPLCLSQLCRFQNEKYDRMKMFRKY
jgi:hypothetical protein